MTAVTKQEIILANIDVIVIDNDDGIAWSRKDAEIMEFVGHTFRPATTDDVVQIVGNVMPIGELYRVLRDGVE